MAWADHLEEAHGAKWSNEYLNDSIGYVRTKYGMLTCRSCDRTLTIDLINRESQFMPKLVAACFTCFKAGKTKWYWEAEDWKIMLEKMGYA